MRNLSLFLLIVILSSCSTSSDVVRKGFFQKRKYKKGYHLSFKKREIEHKVNNDETLLVASKSKINKKNRSDNQFVSKTVKNHFFVENVAVEKSSIYASKNIDESIEYESVFSKLVGDTLVDDYVNTASEDVNAGAQKIRIHRSRLYRILAFVGFGIFIVGVALFPQLGVLGKFIFLPYLLGLFGYYASLFNLVRYTEAKVPSKDPSRRDTKLLNRARKLKNMSKFTLFFLGLSIALLLAILLLKTISTDLLALLMILWFVLYVHFMVFFIITIVNYLILYFSQRKEMKADMAK